MLAIAVQCFIVQTHVHSWTDPLAPHAQVVAFDIAHGALTADEHQHSDHGPATPHRHGSGNCYICQSAAAGTAVLTSAPTLNAIGLSSIANIARLPRMAPQPGPRSHAWRSRAPPLQL